MILFIYISNCTYWRRNVSMKYLGAYKHIAIIFIYTICFCYQHVKSISHQYFSDHVPNCDIFYICKLEWKGCVNFSIKVLL